MTTEQHQKALTTRKLTLSKRRALAHYLDFFLMIVISIFLGVYVLRGYSEETSNYNSPYLLIFLAFPIATIVIYLSQRRLLRLASIETNHSKSANYMLAKETLKTLGWRIKVDNKGFIEAYTNNFGFWTWTDQMISIFISDNKILYNSIGNVDSFATQAVSWGQNLRNRKRFRNALGILATKHSS
jgi:hypothetical protein